MLASVVRRAMVKDEVADLLADVIEELDHAVGAIQTVALTAVVVDGDARSPVPSRRAPIGAASDPIAEPPVVPADGRRCSQPERAAHRTQQQFRDDAA